MESLEEFLNDIAPGGDWDPLIDYINKNYISKDKIREIINKLKKQEIYYSETIAILEKLLEDN